MLPSVTPNGSRLADQAVRAIIVRYAVLAVGTAISVLLSRSLEAEGRGAYAYVIALASSIAWAAHLSIETALVVRWSSAQNRKELVGSALTIGLVAGVTAVVAGVGWVLITQPATPFGTETWMLAVAVATTPAVLLALYTNAVLANDGRIEEMNRVALGATAIQFIALIVLVASNTLTVGSAILLWTLSSSLPTFVLLRKIAQSPGIAWPGWKGARRLVSVGLKYHPGMLALALILRVDLLILGARVAVAELGIYSLAVALAELTLVAASASSQVALQVQVRGEPEENAKFAAAVARTNLALAGAIMIALLAVGPWAITFVFGESYAGTLVPVLFLAPGVLALAVSRPIGVFLARLNHPLWMSSGMIIGLAGNVMLNLVLIPIWGILGAAIASSIVYIGIFAWQSVWFIRVTSLSFSTLIASASDITTAWNLVRDRR